MERIWSDFEPLVRPLRYSTAKQRVTELNFQVMHRNKRGRDRSGKSTLRKLHSLRGHTKDYFKAQWACKKAIQSQTISQSSTVYLKHVAELVELEEERLENLERKKKSRQRCKHKKEAASLPNTLVLLEKAIERVTEKLGDVQLCELTGRSDACAKPLVKICVAKGKLFGAKADVIEHRRRAGNAREAQLRRKHATYVRLARKYNERFTPGTLLATALLQEVEGMDLGDTFLNFGGLIHSNEPWAVDDATQEGIQAYIDKKIDILRQDIINDIIPTWANRDIMLAISSSLSCLAWRTWLSWNSKVITLLNN
ncbi:hypothetical protein DFH28DRAFT_1081845 [Melampsora americana]|nr:hypothetical protein DFH28DRAFT_1081845 [Melampsora americana]